METNSVLSEECSPGYIALHFSKGNKFLHLYLSEEIVSSLLAFERK